MKIINNYIKGNLTKRLSFILFIALAGIGGAMAESKFSVADFTIKPGEERVVAINFENADNISSLQVDFTLPEGLEYKSFKNNEERIERGVHTSYVDLQKGTTNKYRFTVFAAQNDPIPGEGALVYLTLKAGDNFTKPGKIKFDNAHLSDPDANRIDPADFFVNVSPDVGTVEASEPAFSIKPENKHAVGLIMNNTVNVYGVEGRITLPEGLTYEKNSRGKIVVNYGDRLPQDAILQINEETGKFIISAMSGEPFGDKGSLFSVNVVAGKDMAETVDIVIKEIKVSSENDVVFSFGEVMTVKVTNSYLVEYLPAMETADGLQAKLDEAVKTIAEVAPDVKDSEEIIKAAADIQKDIDDLKKAIEDAYNNSTLGAGKDNILEVVPGIGAAIEQLIEDAKKAQETADIGNMEIAGEGIEGIYTISGSKTVKAVKGTVNIIRYSDGSVRKLFVK